jgi:hypothetical protein
MKEEYTIVGAIRVFEITTPVNDRGYYIVPEDEKIPKKYWGLLCKNKLINWIDD